MSDKKMKDEKAQVKDTRTLAERIKEQESQKKNQKEEDIKRSKQGAYDFLTGRIEPRNKQ